MGWSFGGEKRWFGVQIGELHGVKEGCPGGIPPQKPFTCLISLPAPNSTAPPAEHPPRTTTSARRLPVLILHVQNNPQQHPPAWEHPSSSAPASLRAAYTPQQRETKTPQPRKGRGETTALHRLHFHTIPTSITGCPTSSSESQRCIKAQDAPTKEAPYGPPTQPWTPRSPLQVRGSPLGC